MTRSEFDQLIRQQSRRLYGFAFRILRNREEAEDVVQEVFIRLWKMREKLDGYSSPDALATAMTKNCCIDLIRKLKHSSHGEPDSTTLLKFTSPSPHEQMESREAGEILGKLIRELPELYRNILEKRDIDGCSFEEIAKMTGQNVNTIRVTLSRARKMIRDEYNRYHYERKQTEGADRKVL
jgi:RNA polymerase sigma-70 factor (ECF subfamily)